MPTHQAYRGEVMRRPWINSYRHAKQRCENPNHHAYRLYGGKGIKFLISHKDFEHLWFRDNADLMESPSIDRKDSDKSYTLENCRFIERAENGARTGRKPVLNLKTGKEYTSICDAAKDIGVCVNTISKQCNGHRKTAVWEFINAA